MNLITPNGTGQWQRRPYNPSREIYSYIDEFMVGLVKMGKEQADLSLACKPGCAACCTYFLGAYDIEAEAAVDYIELEFNTARKNRVIQRLASWTAAWDKINPDDKVGMEPATIVWQSMRFACPMLDLSNNQCTIYAVRPSVCRTFHATTDQKQGTVSCYNNPSFCGPQKDAPEACWTDDTHVACNHMPRIFMLRNDINALVMPYMLAKMSEYRPKIGYGSFIHFMLTIGKKKYNWKPGSIIALPVLQNGVIAPTTGE